MVQSLKHFQYIHDFRGKNAEDFLCKKLLSSDILCMRVKGKCEMLHAHTK